MRSPAKGNRTRFVCSALLKLSFQFVRRPLKETPVHAIVGLDRRGDVPMPHQHLDDLGVLLHLEEHRAVCMPQRVEMEVVTFQAILLHQANEHRPRPVIGSERTLVGGEDDVLSSHEGDARFLLSLLSDLPPLFENGE